MTAATSKTVGTSSLLQQMTRQFGAGALKAATNETFKVSEMLICGNLTFSYLIQASEIEIKPADLRKAKPQLKKDYIFGKTFTDHMLSIDYSKQTGWAKPQIVPYGPIKLETSATVLHYGISVHEGISIVENPRKGTL